MPHSQPMHRRPFGPVIATHWQEHYPLEAAKLQAAGQLESTADLAGGRAGDVLSECLKSRMLLDRAIVVATEVWAAAPPEPTTTSL
jgi:hypothetical protein